MADLVLGSSTWAHGAIYLLAISPYLNIFMKPDSRSQMLPALFVDMNDWRPRSMATGVIGGYLVGSCGDNLAPGTVGVALNGLLRGWMPSLQLKSTQQDLQGQMLQCTMQSAAIFLIGLLLYRILRAVPGATLPQRYQFKHVMSAAMVLAGATLTLNHVLVQQAVSDKDEVVMPSPAEPPIRVPRLEPRK